MRKALFVYDWMTDHQKGKGKFYFDVSHTIDQELLEELELSIKKMLAEKYNIPFDDISAYWHGIFEMEKQKPDGELVNIALELFGVAMDMVAETKHRNKCPFCHVSVDFEDAETHLSDCPVRRLNSMFKK